MITLSQNSGMAGRFMVEMHTVSSDGSEIPGSRRVVAPWQDNLITDSGLDNMANADFMGRCSVGAGNTAPTAGDTELASLLDSVNGIVARGPAGDDFVSVVGTYVFGQGRATGIIAEVCVRPSSGSITTRALIEDENGDPTTIAKGPMDVLTVTYQLREYPDQGAPVTQVTNPHTSQVYDVTQMTHSGLNPDRLLGWHNTGAANVGDQSALPLVTVSGLTSWDGSRPSTTVAGRASLKQVPPYVPGTYSREVVATFNENSGNLAGGIQSFVSGVVTTANWGDAFHIQASFDPPIDKDNTKTLIITLRKSWGRL